MVPELPPQDVPPDAGPPPFVPNETIPEPPEDPLAESSTVGCKVYLEESCVGGALQRCEIYDSGAQAFVDDPPALLRRVFLYDRYHDLYASPDLQTAEPVFTGAMPADTPESVWGDPAVFHHYAGNGDSAIWTGAATNADIFRYAVTGTEADYERMEDRIKALLLKFDVTGVPGYLARYHYLEVPAGTPPNPDHILRDAASSPAGKRDVVMEAPETIEGLPDAYLSGIPSLEADAPITGTPMWNGHPSIDQYTGPMTAFPVAWPLLRDPTIKERIARHMVCYLNRLQRVEILNLTANEDIGQLVTDYFAGSSLNLDPDDIDLTSSDRAVFFLNRGLVAANVDTFDRSCPTGPPREASVTLDATSDDFITELLDLVTSLGEQGEGKPEQVDHAYAPTLRGGDASHMVHLATMAYYFTGDSEYRDFLFDDLVDDLGVIGVALTTQAFRQPDWCLKFYGDHITYGTHWQLISLLPPGDLRDGMVQVMHEEQWEKALGTHRSAKFEVMYAASGDESELPARADAIASAVAQLEGFGGPGEYIDAPRRTYNLDRGFVAGEMEALGIAQRCPTPEERARCEDGLTVLGITVEQQDITHTCDGRPAECPMGDGECADALAAEGLPPQLRAYADFMWQRNPFQIGDGQSVDGQKQSPGRDLSEPYWMARYYGYLTEGAGMVLAWRDVDGGACEAR